MALKLTSKSKIAFRHIYQADQLSSVKTLYSDALLYSSSKMIENFIHLKICASFANE